MLICDFLWNAPAFASVQANPPPPAINCCCDCTICTVQYLCPICSHCFFPFSSFHLLMRFPLVVVIVLVDHHYLCCKRYYMLYFKSDWSLSAAVFKLLNLILLIGLHYCSVLVILGKCLRLSLLLLIKGLSHEIFTLFLAWMDISRPEYEPLLVFQF